MVFVPLVHGANQIIRWMSSYEGIMPFRVNDSEQPEINYFHMPIRGLYELRRMVDDMQNNLNSIRCPVLLLQGNGDPVVMPQSAEMIYDQLRDADRSLEFIESERHGILNENLSHAQVRIIRFFRGAAGQPHGAEIQSGT